MIKGDKIINDLVYGNISETIAKTKNISIMEARSEISKMSFKDHIALEEADIVPPSGQPLGPTGTTGTNQSTNQSTASTPAPPSGNTKGNWAGKGSPFEVGMTVGLKGPTGAPTPGEISYIDSASKGVRVRDPSTGEEQWHNNDALIPYSGNPGGTEQTKLNNRPGQGGFNIDQLGQMMEDKELTRLKQLAGISENASSGASSAGAIASAPTAMGSVNKRKTTEQKKEYTRTAPAKSIIGDTKSHQASGELSATLVANGKKTATRINNGRKKP